ncbi:class I SAM-dependent methyltransferase [Rossellomorea marisflavi]|uniref:class I SAM-dependent methyltransferase n=1 Tax=Rossellomorea marisflavi TaxID=189381 RepID=UPI0009A7F752|nr:class I SAM-dependent methyltransferase [Rossellomorea marisflavi]
MSGNKWNATHYDDKIGFVSLYGKGLIDILDPKEGEEILDLGCGTGDLTQEIGEFGAVVRGIDYSEDMIQRAREKYPTIYFDVGDAANFHTPQPMDAVFSNAALHWVRDADGVASSVARALRPGGRFVAEFGGSRNVGTIISGVEEELTARGIDATSRNPWYFPTVGDYSSLLEHHGFRVSFIHHYERPTPLSDGEKGLDHWLDGFADDFFPEFEGEEKAEVYKGIKERVRPALFKDGEWVADYWRIRVVAVKE